MIIRLLTSIVSASNYTKCASLSNQKCMIQPTVINLHPSKCSQELHNYQFAFNLDTYIGNCNTLNDLSNKICVPNKTEDLNLSIIREIKESNILTKQYHANVNVMVENVIQIKT